MCGIAGYALKAPAPGGVLERMTAALTHRGPDGEGYFREGGMALGHRRLAILDVEGGAQPITNEDGTVVVVYNGEIYNFMELRDSLERSGHRFNTRSDTEVLCHLYEEEGEAFLPRLNGIYAFALYDRTRKKLLLARDPVGVKPLYYASCPEGLLFASELKAIRQHPAFRDELDLRALGLFLTCEYVPAPFTICRDAKKLLPGHVLVVEDGRAVERRFWTWTFDAHVPANFEDCALKLRSLVADAVKGQLISDVPLGVFLSGGIDSSVVTACMAKAGGKVESFSIGFEDASFDESAHARAVARHLGTVHHEHRFCERDLLDEIPRVLSGLDEPFADPSVFPTALLSRFARGQVTVALGGDGGDELFAGYPTYWVHRDYRRYRALPKWARARALALADAALPVSHANLTFPYKLRKFADGAEEPMPSRHHLWLGAWKPRDLKILLPGYREDLGSASAWMPPAPSQDPVTTAQWLDFHTYLLEDILAKVDRASMMASLEARVPLLDYRVVQLAFSLPPEFRLRGRSGKRVVRRAFASDLPEGHFERPKRGFGIPLARWLAGPLRPFAEELLSDEVLGRVPFLTKGLPQRLWKEHLEMRADHRKPLWALLCFLDWWRRRERV